MAPVKITKAQRAKIMEEATAAPVMPPIAQADETPILPEGTAIAPTIAPTLTTAPETKTDEDARSTVAEVAESFKDTKTVRPVWAANDTQLAGLKNDLNYAVAAFFNQRPLTADLADWAAPSDEATMGRVQAHMAANPGIGLFAAMGAVTAQIEAERKAHEAAKTQGKPVDALWLRDVAQAIDDLAARISIMRKGLGVRAPNAGTTSERAATNPTAATKTTSKAATRNQAWITQATKYGLLDGDGRMIITTHSEKGYHEQGRKFLIVNDDGTFTDRDGDASIRFVNWQSALGVEGQVAPRAMLGVYVGQAEVRHQGELLNQTATNAGTIVIKDWVHFDNIGI